MNRLFYLFVFLVAACSHNSQPQGSSADKVELTSNLKGTRYSNIYFAGQPSDEDWKALKEQGFVHVVNLRSKSEIDEPAEKKMVEEAGLTYINLPVEVKKGLDKEIVQTVGKTVKSNAEEGKVLVHCGSGNRAAYWAGAHFYLDHGFAKEKAMGLAYELGMKSELLHKKLSDFIDSHPQEKKAP